MKKIERIKIILEKVNEIDEFASEREIDSLLLQVNNIIIGIDIFDLISETNDFTHEDGTIDVAKTCQYLSDMSHL